MGKLLLQALFGLTGFVAVTLLLVAGSDDNSADAVAGITELELRSTVAFLASDELQGRESDSPGNRITARYLAHQFELAGLLPAGDSDSFFQSVGLVQSDLGESNQLEFSRRKPRESSSGVLREDFYPSSISGLGKASGDLLFAGFGITAAPQDYDDYRDLSAEGKVVLILTGLPAQDETEDSILGMDASEYSKDWSKALNAQEHGAAGVILLNPTRKGKMTSRANSTYPSNTDRKKLLLQSLVEQIKIPVVYASADFIKAALPQDLDWATLEQSDKNFTSLERKEIQGVQVSLETDLVRNNTKIRNVIGYLPGSDPDLQHESVVISAHFDHVGTRGDEVFYGADDDASGTAAVLEIAEAFSERLIKPRRSLIFALWNGEERGLLGSYGYTLEPTFSQKQVVAVFQLDMIGRNQEVPASGGDRFRGLEEQSADENVNTMHVVGFSRSDDLRELIERANQSVGLKLLYSLDDHPLNLIRRSDHWPFLQAGIPSVLLTTGLHPDYHTPEDTADRINYSKLTRISRLVFYGAWETANQSDRPRLN